MYDDPRTKKADSHDEQTDDSDDAMADLEKEYFFKKKQLLEERRLKKEQANLNKYKPRLEVAGSPPPSPERKPEVLSQHSGPLMTRPSPTYELKPRNVPKCQFGSKLYENNQNARKSNDLEERELEFQNVPERSNIAVEEKDKYSGLMLSKRYLSISQQDTLMANKKALRIEKLFSKIVPPEYFEPHYANWVVVGVVLTKSDPKMTASGKDKKYKPRKYLRLTVGNFNTSVDLMIFGDAFERYWKLQVGDVVAVLNPNVSKYTKGKGFNLSISDGLDSVLEVGRSKDFGLCTATRKSDKSPCSMVVDRSKTNLCVYHEESKFASTSNRRMELNGSVNLKAPRNSRGQQQSLYLSGDANGLFKGSYVAYNEQTTTYSGQGIGFNDKKFIHPLTMNGQSEKRRKLSDTRKNQQLEQKLLDLLKTNHLQIKSLGLIKDLVLQEAFEREYENEKASKRKSAFNSDLLHRIGFDPTGDKQGNTQACEQLQTNLKELYALSSSKQGQRKLTSSHDDHVTRVDKWKNNARAHNDYNGRINSDTGIVENVQNISGTRKATEAIKLEDQETSDSDLDIDFGSAAAKDRYVRAVHQAHH